MTVMIKTDDCKGCGECVNICPLAALKIVSNKVTVNEYCIECGLCVLVCVKKALFIK